MASENACVRARARTDGHPYMSVYTRMHASARECILRYMCALARTCVRACVRGSVCASICVCIREFVRACIRKGLHACACAMKQFCECMSE
eukprot:5324840-Pleurochrysis_carterae.AAC.1